MADFLTTSTTLDFSKVAYDQMAYFALRPQLFFDQVADVEPTHQSMPGLSVVFQIMNDIPPQTTPLTEGVDVSAIAMSDTTLTLTLQEYGAALIHTAKLRGTSFVQIDPIAANIIGFNAGVSLDSIARDVLTLGSQVGYVGSNTARATIAKTDTFNSGVVRNARAALRRQNVPEIGNAFVAFVHPDAVVDLQSEAGTAGNALNSWRAPHTYSAPSEIWSGEIGQYEGVRFIETPRAPIQNGAGAGATFNALSVTSGSTTGTYTGATYDPQVGAVVYGANATTAATSFSGALGSTYITSVTPGQDAYGNIAPGSGTVTFNKAATATTSTVAGASFAKGGASVYQTLIMGRQALAKTHSIVDGNSAYPHIVPGPVVDRLRRNVPLGWYWLGAYGIFRQAALYRLEHGASLDTPLTSFGGAADISTGGSEGTDTPLVDLS